jgi:hypothetical protein
MLALPSTTNLEAQVPVFMSSQEQDSPVLPPGTGFPIHRHLWTRRTTLEVL